MTEESMDFTVTPVPPEGHRWFCELDGRLHSRPRQTPFTSINGSPLISSVAAFCESLDAPSDKAHGEQWRAPLEHQPGGLFLAAPTSLAKAFAATFYHHGWTAAIEMLAHSNVHPLGRVLRRLVSPVKHQAGGHHPLLAAHPTAPLLAVACREDVVRVVGWAKTQAHDFKAKHRVLCLAWRPYAQYLVAGCAAGLLIWSAKQENKYSDLVSGKHNLLRAPNGRPVTTVSWHPKGDLLVAVAGRQMYLVRPETEHWWPLPQSHAPQLLIWSPCGHRLLTASTGAVFHLWDTATWTAERWTVSRGSLVAACFSQNGRLLIFGDEAGIYCLPPDGPAFLVDQTRVAALAWNGDLLAAVHYNSDVVHIYSTQTEPQLNIRPNFIIGGKEGESPSAIEFFPSIKGATVLVILWSSGRTQAFPFTTEVEFCRYHNQKV
ncbi:aladin-like [Neocloeon triangulifer]|uniref:aladin-like n=1 Tax=Neocloeon triangulifer TaxID=2078957 RepID=UPI00286F99C0|nr:aladin-like [Neocloeon triangulifer]